MEPLLLERIYAVSISRMVFPTITYSDQFTNGPLAKEHGLEITETDKPVLEAEDLVEVLRCHWATDTNIFPNERQRVQLAALLLLTAVTGFRPGALLAVRYQDIDLFVLQILKSRKTKLLMQL